MTIGELLIQRCSAHDDRDGGRYAQGRSMKWGVPGGVICSSGLVSEGVLVVWSHI